MFWPLISLDVASSILSYIMHVRCVAEHVVVDDHDDDDVDDDDDVIGMAVDWIADNLYWTDEDRGYIIMSRLDGRYRTVLLTGLTRPKSVTVNPLTGFVLITASAKAVMFLPRSASCLLQQHYSKITH